MALGLLNTSSCDDSAFAAHTKRGKTPLRSHHNLTCKPKRQTALSAQENKEEKKHLSKALFPRGKKRKESERENKGAQSALQYPQPEILSCEVHHLKKSDQIKKTKLFPCRLIYEVK